MGVARSTIICQGRLDDCIYGCRNVGAVAIVIGSGNNIRCRQSRGYIIKSCGIGLTAVADQVVAIGINGTVIGNLVAATTSRITRYQTASEI